MGVWAYPGTVEKAVALAEILDGPLPAHNVCVLYDLVGDDDLFDEADDLVGRGEPESDIRHSVVGVLKGWLGQLDTFSKPWEPRAVDVVRGAVDRF